MTSLGGVELTANKIKHIFKYVRHVDDIAYNTPPPPPPPLEGHPPDISSTLTLQPYTTFITQDMLTSHTAHPRITHSAPSHHTHHPSHHTQHTLTPHSTPSYHTVRPHITQYGLVSHTAHPRITHSTPSHHTHYILTSHSTPSHHTHYILTSHSTCTLTSHTLNPYTTLHKLTRSSQSKYSSFLTQCQEHNKMCYIQHAVRTSDSTL